MRRLIDIFNYETAILESPSTMVFIARTLAEERKDLAPLRMLRDSDLVYTLRCECAVVAAQLEKINRIGFLLEKLKEEFIVPHTKAEYERLASEERVSSEVLEKLQRCWLWGEG